MFWMDVCGLRGGMKLMELALTLSKERGNQGGIMRDGGVFWCRLIIIRYYYPHASTGLFKVPLLVLLVRVAGEPLASGQAFPCAFPCAMNDEPLQQRGTVPTQYRFSRAKRIRTGTGTGNKLTKGTKKGTKGQTGNDRLTGVCPFLPFYKKPTS